MKKSSFLIIISLLVSACASLKPVISANDEEQCISPLYKVAFPVVTSTSGGPAPRQMPPQGNWQMQDTLPFQDIKGISLMARPQQHELWLKVADAYEVYKYSIDAKQWKSYNMINTTLAVPERLFVSKEGAVWGVGVFAEVNDDRKNVPLLSRFNDTTNSFEFISDNSGLLQTSQVLWAFDITEDQSGLLWFFAQERNGEQALYSFDVKTQQAKRHFSIKQGESISGNLTVGPDSSVWFDNIVNNELIQYTPSSQKTHIYKGYPEPVDLGGLPFDLSDVNYLFFDHSGRLWLANYGWLDFSTNNSPVWNQIIQPPVFVTDSELPESQYQPSYQFSIYQSSNGWYWFTGGAGVVRLDLQNESWCLTTTGISEVVEDYDHNLWIAVFGHLYKYPLEH